MYIKIRKDGDSKQEWILEISKQNKVSAIENLIEKKIGVKADEQTLIFKGKTLKSDVPVLDYQIENNNVIQMFVCTSKKRNSKLKIEVIEDGFRGFEKSDSSSTNNNNPDKNLIETKSEFYTIGDCIDVMVEDDGTWYEAVIVKIFLKNLAGSSSTSISKVEETDLIFRVRSAEHIIPGFETDASFKDIRPRSYYTYKLEELCPQMIVLANYNLEDPKARGGWYDCKIQKVSRTSITATLLVGGEGAPIENCSIAFIQEIMRIESPTLLSDSTEKNLHSFNRKYPYHCNTCKDNVKKKCRDCGCKICRGKEEWEKIILCDECDDEYHIFCLAPPLENIPEDDWYCQSCKVDDSKIVKRGEDLKLSKKRASMASKTSDSTRDWGKGMACAGRTKVCTIVPKDHVGPIPGIDVGTRWKYRIQVSEAGVHRPHVSGIHGTETKGATSIVLSCAYDDDVDDGNEFIYSGSGGRDLSGNKRVNVQTSDQLMTRANKALAINCNVPFDENGAEATDWKNGIPVRVVRNSKGKEHSKYCPDDGLRYDGIYKVIKYYPEKGKSGFIVYKYVFRRDDPNPAPWEKGGQEFDIIYPDGYLEARAEKEKDTGKESKTKKGTKRKDNSNIMADFLNIPKKSKMEYRIPDEVNNLIMKDVNNSKLWLECQGTLENGKVEFLEKVGELFTCICCQDIVVDPVTTECNHNFCAECIRRAFKLQLFTCPCCRFELGKDYDININENLSVALKLLFPGYGK